MNFYDPLKNILKRGAESEKYKYSLIISAVTMVHICLVAFFGVCRIYLMMFLNMGSVALYLICLLAIRQGRDMRGVFYSTYLEIIIHSFAATLCIGWRFGFPQYVIALVPFGYYMCHALLEGRRRYTIATLLGLAAFASFVSCRVLSRYVGPLYRLELPGAAELGVYIFNTFCNFSFLFMVTAIFLVEMQTATNQLQKQNAVLDAMANIDPLTGLYNRRSMHQFLESAARPGEGSSFCLVMCDIDDFKKINDTYGHDAGDYVLKEVARMAREQVGEYGHACRWGGEEMLLIIRGDMELAPRIAEAIRQEVSGFTFQAREQAIRCSLTIGVALHRGGDTIDHTITHADDNLYYGKRHGKNRVVTDPELNAG